MKTKRHKFEYNPDTLKFEISRLTTKDVIRKVLKYAVVFLFALMIAFGVAWMVESPKEKMLQHEVAQYKSVINDIEGRLTELDKGMSDLEMMDNNVYRQLLNMTPNSNEVLSGAHGGSDNSNQFNGLTYKDDLVDVWNHLDLLSYKINLQKESLDEIYDISITKEKMMACLPAIAPIRDSDKKSITSYFGMRIDPIYHVRKFHSGLDFSAARGTEIFATGDGTVTEVKTGFNGGYGTYVKINHGFSYSTMYAHMQKAAVKVGQKVKRGQLIGYVGNTGKSSGPHVHYEVQKNGVPINPVNFMYKDITPEMYEQVLEQSNQPSGMSMD